MPRLSSTKPNRRTSIRARYSNSLLEDYYVGGAVYARYLRYSSTVSLQTLRRRFCRLGTRIEWLNLRIFRLF